MATVTQAAADHYEYITSETALAVAAARRAWGRVNPDFIGPSWREQAMILGPALGTSMQAAAYAGTRYGVMDLAQRGVYVQPTAFAVSTQFGHAAPSGVPLETVLLAPMKRALKWIGDGEDPLEALSKGRSLLDGIVRTFVADAGRLAGSTDIATRPGVGWIRMLNPPSCDACSILAGRWYRWNAGFLRHPRCRCIHRPSQSLAAARSEGLIDDPYEYFNSLSEEEQNRRFGKDKAQAIRDGGDIYRVQNSWRGRDGLTTAEGTSKRGYASEGRLTPEGIYRTAGSREEAVNLLRQHGYVLDGGQVAGGSIQGRDYEGFGQLGRGGTRMGASRAVEQAQLTGVRVEGDRYTATAAERRVIDARSRYEAALEGRNPYGRGEATALVKARAELEYRDVLERGGQIYTS